MKKPKIAWAMALMLVAAGFVDAIFEKLVEINDAGVTILMVEQNAKRALSMSDRGYVLDLGKSRWPIVRKEQKVLLLGTAVEEAPTSLVLRVDLEVALHLRVVHHEVAPHHHHEERNRESP